MTFPRGVASILDEVDPSRLGGIPTQKAECAGAKFHSPTPLLVHEVALSTDHVVYLCGVCRDNLRLLRELQKVRDGQLPWTIRREFGNRLRSLAKNGKVNGD
jgi:hypothetical protein